MTNSYVAVIGHHCKEEIFKVCKNKCKEELCEATCIGDALIICLDVRQHLDDCGCAETDVIQGQVGEEEVHGGVEVGLKAYTQNYEQVSQNGDQVDEQEEAKDERLKFWVICKSQKKEL